MITDIYTKTFTTHCEVLNEIYNVSIGVHRRGEYILNDNEVVWFPNPDNETWGNAVEGDFKAIWELMPIDPEKAERKNSYRESVRHVFMKFKDGYRYVGDYLVDKKRSIPGCTIYNKVI